MTGVVRTDTIYDLMSYMADVGLDVDAAELVQNDVKAAKLVQKLQG